MGPGKRPHRGRARLDVDELAALVSRWDAEAFDTVSACGGRVVKTIGDEVMFVALPDRAAETALALRDLGREGRGLQPGEALPGRYEPGLYVRR